MGLGKNIDYEIKVQENSIFKIKKYTKTLIFIIFCAMISIFFMHEYLKAPVGGYEFKAIKNLDMNNIESYDLDYISSQIDKAWEEEFVLSKKQNEKLNGKLKYLKKIYFDEKSCLLLNTFSKPHVVLKRATYDKRVTFDEDKILADLDSPYICKVLGTKRTKGSIKDLYESQTHIWIMMEYLDIDLVKKIDSVDENTIRSVATCVLKGLEYLHSKRIAHLDLKINNVLGKKTDKGEIIYKIIDFGISRVITENDEYLSLNYPWYGTYPFLPPEIHLKYRCCLKSDIWLVGALCWVLSLKKILFFDHNAISYEKFSYFLFERTKKLSDQKNHRFYFQRSTSFELRDFIKSAMKIDPRNRLSARDLLEHPYIKNRKIHFYDESSDFLDF